jgi:hypothetical protein
MVEGGGVLVAFIGPEQHEDVEAGRCLGGRQWCVLQCISYGSGGELGGGETKGRDVARRGRGGGKLVSVVKLHDMVVHNRPLPEGEEEEASLSRW